MSNNYEVKSVNKVLIDLSIEQFSCYTFESSHKHFISHSILLTVPHFISRRIFSLASCTPLQIDIYRVFVALGASVCVFISFHFICFVKACHSIHAASWPHDDRVKKIYYTNTEQNTEKYPDHFDTQQTTEQSFVFLFSNVCLRLFCVWLFFIFGFSYTTIIIDVLLCDP